MTNIYLIKELFLTTMFFAKNFRKTLSIITIYENPSSVIFNEAIIYIDNATNNSVNNILVGNF